CREHRPHLPETAGLWNHRLAQRCVRSVVFIFMADVTTAGLRHAIEAERAIEPGSNLRASWEALLKDARNCTRCDLYKHATQTVFGEGPLDARIMFVGEQPGDQEDLAGRP